LGAVAKDPLRRKSKRRSKRKRIACGPAPREGMALMARILIIHHPLALL